MSLYGNYYGFLKEKNRMKRLPRKRKKQVKKIVSKKTALKTAMCAMVTAQAMAQTAIISAIPTFSVTAVPEKALKVAGVLVDTKNAINKILSEPPNSWKDFLR